MFEKYNRYNITNFFLRLPFCKSFNECVIQHFNSNSSCYTGRITSETQLKVIFTKYLTSALIYTIPHLESQLEYSMFQVGGLILFHLKKIQLPINNGSTRLWSNYTARMT